MRHDFKLKKRVIVVLLVLLAAADLALGAYSWELASARSPKQELMLLTLNRELLKKDIQRAREIRSRIPAVQKDCDAFEQSLFPDTTGYSAVSAELGSLAAKSGLRVEGRAFSTSSVKGRDLIRLSIDAQITGDYRGVVRFLNELQRSTNFYSVQGLSARPGISKGSLAVIVHIKTYFRPA